MQCPQGNGTAADTQAYADCQSSCISSYSTAPPVRPLQLELMVPLLPILHRPLETALTAAVQVRQPSP